MFAVQVDINLVGTFRTVRACLPHLVESRGYALLNASASAIMAPPGLGAYGATKAGIESIGDTLRREVAHLGVDVGVLYLLWVQTDMVEGSRRQSAVLATVLSGLGGPLGKAMPLSRATRTIVAGIEQRKRRVTAPRIVAAMHRIRGLIGRPAERELLNLAPEVDAATLRDLEGELGDGFRTATAAGAAAARAVEERR